ncbi:hypothetical protein HPB49_006274 [Dermacentor silvarum]|uniref:Uncharacterized protein n=1 Tax=Dermacentor silvarum TaxID=543639 RepID=A0ACB8DBT4_DERSI|nr:hypothetical protein HPB49_006274 [Dermacentor silvarum]
MFLKLQVLLVCVVVEAYALDHQQPNQAGYAHLGFAGYAAAPAPYRRYDAYAFPPQPYSFGYDNVDEYGNQQFRSEQGDSNNAKTGSYGYRDANGLYRRVNYVADGNGFRATVDTNEPGTAPGTSADAVFNAAPVVPPVPSGVAGAYAYTPYGGQGYVASGPALGGYAYEGNAPYGYGAVGYAAGYASGVYGTPAAYEGWPSAHHGYRRR